MKLSIPKLPKLPPKLDNLVRDRNVLRAVVVLAVLNLMGYIIVRDLDAVIFFLIVGFLSSYFTKNMVIVMAIAMIATNFLVIGRNRVQIVHAVEGMASGAGRKKTADDEGAGEAGTGDVEKAVAKKVAGGASGGAKGVKVSPSKKRSGGSSGAKVNDMEDDEDDVGDLDHGATMEAAYDNIDKLLNSDAIKNMSTDTQKLADRQAKLMEQMQTITPMVEQSMKTLDKLGGAESMTTMMNGLNNIMSKFGGGAKK